MFSRKALSIVAFNLAALGSVASHAQTLALKATPLADQPTSNQLEEIVIDLKNHFAFDGVTGQIVQLDTDLGIFNIELLPQDAPKTVENFLKYVDGNDYDDIIVHRLAKNFVMQAGGFGRTKNTANRGEVVNEFKRSNIRGTIAMAKLPDKPNSATNEWFVNLADNSGGTPKLDSQNGGFTVFARVIGTGMTVVDEINKLVAYNLSGYPFYLGVAFDSVPLEPNKQTFLDELVTIKTTDKIATYPSPTVAKAAITFTAPTSSNPAIAAASLSGSDLVLDLAQYLVGESTISIGAKDTNGNTANLTFKVLLQQQAAIATTLDPASKSVSALAGSYSVAIDANAIWEAESQADWIWIDVDSGVGPGATTLAYEPNTSIYTRSGEVDIGVATHVVTQDGARLGASDQTFREWLEARFDEDEADDIYDSADTYDGDGDGLPIGFEFALGLDDDDERSNLRQTMVSEDGQLFLVIAPQSAAVEVDLLTSNNLSTAPAAWAVVQDAPKEIREDALWIGVGENSAFYRARLTLVGAE